MTLSVAFSSQSPVVGYIEQIFGMQKIMMTGCVVATASIGACFFAENILTVTILWGFVLGLSFGFAHHMVPSLLNYHFPGRESTANGISLSGACIGAVLLSIIMEASIHSYGVSGSFLILSAIIAHAIPICLLIKNPTKQFNKCKTPVLQKVLQETEEYERNQKPGGLKESSDFINTKIQPVSLSSCSGNSQADQRQPYHKFRTVEKFSCYDKACRSDINSNSDNMKSSVVIPSNKTLNTNKTRRFYEFKTEEVLSNEKCDFINKENVNKNGCSNISSADSFRDGNFTAATKRFTPRNFKIFTDPIYIILLIINSGGMILATTVWTIILDFVRDKEVDGGFEIYFVVILALSDFVGRIGFGIIIDKNFLTKPNLTVACFLFAAVLFISFIFVNNHVLLMLLECLIASFLGAIFLLQIVLTHEYIEEEKKIMAMTCRFVLYAPLSLGISPMIGYFRGNHGSYNSVFYILSGISLFCGTTVLFIPYLAKRRRTIHVNSCTGK